MVQDNQRMRSAIRDPSPCNGCTERFTACYDRCPKDKRGELGYKAWKGEIARVKNERRKYINMTHIRKKYHNEGIKYGEK